MNHKNVKIIKNGTKYTYTFFDVPYSVYVADSDLTEDKLGELYCEYHLESIRDDIPFNDAVYASNQAYIIARLYYRDCTFIEETILS